VCFERIARHQLLCHGARQLGIEAATDIDAREFIFLSGRRRGQFLTLSRNICALGICLRTHRHVLACRHRERSGDEPSDPCQEDLIATSLRGCDTDHQACG
jgi:hypothetical protein